MAPFPKLTEAQRKPLLALVEYQKEHGGEVVFALYYWLGTASLRRWGQEDEVVVEIPEEVLGLWYERGYVSPGSRHDGIAGDRTTLILCKEALELKSRMDTPQPFRWILDTVDAWSTDLRALVIAVIGAILTAIVLNLFGLLR